MDLNKESKPLGHGDESGFEFVKDCLKGDPTFAVNFDRLQHHPKYGYIIFELLLCEESQSVNPHTSHPNRYWNKNARKFISLFNVAKDLKATLFLVNYAKKGTQHEDKVRVIRVENINLEGPNYVEGKDHCWTREEFSDWFRMLNRECSFIPENTSPIDLLNNMDSTI